VLVEMLGGDQLQDRIAEVFEALVIARRKRWALVRERAVGYGFE